MIKELLCPICEGYVCEIDVVPAFAYVDNIDTETGVLTWSGSTEVDWNNQHPVHDPPRFMCGDCATEFVIENCDLVEIE